MNNRKRSNDISSSSEAKRPHKSLTILQKVDMLKKLDEGTPPRCLANDFGISCRTVYDIRKNKEKILNFYTSSDTDKGIANRKSVRPAKNADLDAILFEWFKQRRSENIPITGPLLREKAKELHKELKLTESCDYSQGWLTKFKNRHGIRYLKACGEKVGADHEAAEEFIDFFSKFIKKEGLTPDQIYNADETALFWRCLPRNTFVAPGESQPSGTKEDKQRITLLTCANAAGTHKCKLFVVGRSARPRAFKSVKVLPVTYTSSEKAWMTKDLTLEWFKNHFVKEAREHCKSVGLPEDCKILLLLDNCRAHPDEEILKANNISTRFLPANTTSLIQPMDQGIISNLKYRYKSDYLRKLLQTESSPNLIETFKKNFTIKDAVYLVSEAWDSVSQETLVNAWHNLWPESLFIDIPNDNEEFHGFKPSSLKTKAAELLQYAKNVGNSANISAVTEDFIQDLLTAEDSTSVTEHVTDAQIISSILNPNESNDSETESESETNEKIPIDRGLAIGKEYLNFLEQQSCISQQELMTVHRMQDRLIKLKFKKLKQTTLDSIFTKQKPA